MKFLFSGVVCDDADAEVYAYFGIPCVSPGAVRKAVEDASEDGDLCLEVNSPGGNALAGVEISNILRKAAADGLQVSCVVQSHAASAASYAILSANSIQMAPGSQMMLHRPWTHTSGNAQDLEQTKQMLESMFESMLDLYTLRCRDKCSRDELRAICENETWLTAERCVALGLADSLWKPEKSNVRLDIAAAVSGLPDITVLRERFQQARANHKSADWREKAHIGLEQERFRFADK